MANLLNLEVDILYFDTTSTYFETEDEDEDGGLGYKQLLLVEDAFRTLKSRLDLRPVYHRLEDRIRAHVLLCWLALLMIRIVENRTGQTLKQPQSHPAEDAPGRVQRNSRSG